MAQIYITDFGGRIPRRSKRLLPPNFAQEAYNTKILSGELRGARSPTPKHSFLDGTLPLRAWRVRPDDDPETVHWFSSQIAEAELLKSPLINDAFDRWYLFEPNQPPKIVTVDDVANGTGPWPLAIQGPTNLPALVPTVIEDLDIRDVVYVYTYVTEWGEETPQSPPATVKVDDAGSVVVSGLYDATAALTGRAYKSVRVYRSVTVGDIGGIFFVRDLPWGTDSFIDDVSDAIISFNELLISQLYSPPVDGLYGARVHPSGALVAFKGSTVHFSEPYRPHAWPEVYQISVADTIVGLEVTGQNVAVLTKGRPVMLYGSHPQQIGILRFPYSEPCQSYGSIVGTRDAVLYASHQGLISFSTVGPLNLTEGMISREEWQLDYLDPRMSAVRHESQYMAISRPGSGFIIDSSDPRAALVDMAFSSDVNIATFQDDPYTGVIFAIDGDTVFLWDEPTSEEADYVWKSREEVLATPVVFSTVTVHLEPRAVAHVPSGRLPIPPFPQEYVDMTDAEKKISVLVEVFVEGERWFVGKCEDHESVRLPEGKKSDVWEIRISGQCRVYSVALTETGRGQSNVR